MIVYMKCSCGSHNRLLIRKLRDEGHEVRLTNIPQWRKEARLYGLELPFKVIDETTRRGEAL